MSARAADSTITTTVISNERGEFAFPSLADGTYQVWAQAVGFATARGEVKVAGAQPAKHAFALQPLQTLLRS